jgi:membrane protease YdiL (CAAX protease family)
MLSPKPWNLETILRLLLGVFVCLSLGAMAVSGFHYAGAGGLHRVVFSLLAATSAIALAAGLVLLSQEWKLEDLVRQFLLILGCLTVGLSLAAWTQRLAGRPPEGSSGEQMIVAEAAVLLFLIGFLRAQRVRWRDAFGLTNQRQRALLAGVIVAFVFLPVGDGLQWVSAQAMARFHWEPQEQQAVHALRISSAWSSRLLLAGLAIVLAPVAEEILFRGVMYPAIKQAGFPRLALWGVSLLFACIHFNVVTFFPLLVLALVLTILYERTDNLLAPITAHALFNALNFVKLYLVEPLLAK